MRNLEKRGACEREVLDCGGTRMPYAALAMGATALKGVMPLGKITRYFRGRAMPALPRPFPKAVTRCRLPPQSRAPVLHSVLIALLLTMHLSTPIHAAEWQPVTPLPEPNAGFACAIINGEIVIAGGTNWEGGTKHWLDRIRVYSPEKNRWREAGRLPTPRAYSAVAAGRDGLYLAGGSSGETTLLDLTRIGADFKTQQIAMIKAPLVYAASAALGHELCVIGGAPDQAGLAAMTNACVIIDLSTGKARSIAPLPVPGFVTGTATACGGKVYVFGGAHWEPNTGEPVNLDTAFVYDAPRNEWRALPHLPSANRGLTAVALDETRVLIAGGYKNDIDGFTADAWIFDNAAATYRAAKPLPYPALVTLITCGDFLYCLGGEDQKKHRTDACYRIPVSEYLTPQKR